MRVALIYGGQSGEHDVSLVTAEAIRGVLDALGYARFDLLLGRDAGASWSGSGQGSLGAHGAVAQGLAALTAWAPDVAFLALHGAYGEDGRVQGALDLLGIPYQGSGVAASALAMDKGRAKAVYRDAGLPVAPDVIVRRGDRVDWRDVAEELGLPAYVKTPGSGSSVGVERVESSEELVQAATRLLREADEVLIEANLPGRELTVPVLEDQDGTPRALPAIEIRPVRAAFFDYEAKYTEGATDELCPAPIDEALAGRVAALGLAAHRALGCRDYSRTDLLLDAQGEPRVIETNTLPGLTPASLFPKAARAAGMTFEGFVDALLRRAVTRGRVT